VSLIVGRSSRGRHAVRPISDPAGSSAPLTGRLNRPFIAPSITFERLHDFAERVDVDRVTLVTVALPLLHQIISFIKPTGDTASCQCQDVLLTRG